MQDFEKLGAFYLGRPYDLGNRAPGDGVLLYDSRDLVTHAAIIGMTGSGKTGLAISLLEEAAIDGVPAIAIDPKGDLANLLLTFPDLAPASFRPWINADEARRQGVSEDDFAAREAENWKKGLAGWGQDGARIQKLKDSAEVAVFTPGSNAGLQISILKSFDPPPPEIVDDHELFGERVSTSVTALLTLAGITADPVKSREHILLSTVVADAWRKNEALDLAALISRVQTPPVQKIGVLDLDAFYPASDRFQLAMALNGLLASPSFQAWLQGDPLDVGQLLYTPQGKPRLSIVSIAHLNDAERMFFVSMLFGQALSWMRRQPGTTSLRAILYMDEVAGYLPPVAMPPSKPPLMTLLKQGRAFGLGVVLATQNPVDIDYKALSNIGTWFLGRLQTERDKLRVLDGLEGAVTGAGGFDRAEMDRTLSALGKRVFLLHNVHDAHPVTFETRWALSYLSGPLTRDHIRALMAPKKAAALAAGAGGGAAAGAARSITSAAANGFWGRGQRFASRPSTGRSPVLRAGAHDGSRHVRAPRVLRRVGAVRRCEAVDQRAPCGDGAGDGDRRRRAHRLADRRRRPDLALGDLDQQPDADGTFAALPSAAAKAKNYALWEKEFGRWLFASQTLDLFRDADTKLVSKPGESERDFRIRLQQASREARDAAKQKLEVKYAPKLAQLTEKLRKAEQAAQREAQQATDSKVQAGFSILATGIGALFGRKTISATNISKAATAARSTSRMMKEGGDVTRAQENIRTIQEQIQELDATLQAEVAELDAASDAAQKPLDAVSLKPKKTNIAVQRVVLAWVAEG